MYTEARAAYGFPSGDLPLATYFSVKLFQNRLEFPDGAIYLDDLSTLKTFTETDGDSKRIVLLAESSDDSLEYHAPFEYHPKAREFKILVRRHQRDPQPGNLNPSSDSHNELHNLLSKAEDAYWRYDTARSDDPDSIRESEAIYERARGRILGKGVHPDTLETIGFGCIYLLRLCILGVVIYGIGFALALLAP